MASIKLTFGTVLQTVTDTAASVSDLIRTGQSGISMLSRSVHHASEKQVIDQTIEKKDYLKNAIMDSAKAHAEKVETIAAFVNVNEGRQKAFNDHMAELNALFEEQNKQAA